MEPDEYRWLLQVLGFELLFFESDQQPLTRQETLTLKPRCGSDQVSPLMGLIGKRVVEKTITDRLAQKSGQVLMTVLTEQLSRCRGVSTGADKPQF